MPDETGALAVAEPVESSTGSEVVESTSEVAESGESSTDASNQVDSSVENEGLTEKAPTKGKINLADVVKKSSDALKAINPALPAALRTAAFEQSALYREFPGGLKEAVALKATLGEYGGAEGVKEVVEANQDYQKLEQQYEKGDPAFLANLADASPASFSQIMPGGLAKWKSVDPDAYNHALAQVMTQTLDGANVSSTLEAIWERLDEKTQPELKNAVASLWKSLDGFRKVGEKAPERKVDPQNEALTRREQELAEREAKAMLTPIASAGRQQITSITDREMGQSYKWSETSAEVQQAVRDRVRQEVISASAKDKVFSREFDRLKERGDAAGLERHVKNFQDRVTPSIVQRVAKLFAVKPKGAGPTIVKPKTDAVASNGAAKQDPGWIRISVQPKPQDIDRRKTTDTMILENKAIDKNGRKITWA